MTATTPVAPRPPVLSVRDLEISTCAQTPVPLVRGVCFDLYPGKVLGVVGESGSGKTLTALAILKLLPTNVAIGAGQVLLDGVDLFGVGPAGMRQIRGRQIALVSQDPGRAMNPVHRVGRQVSEPLVIHTSLHRRERRAATVAGLRRVGIPRAQERLANYPFEFSGGMRQRAMISMALACRPKVLIADEPTTGLDATVQVQVLDLIRSLAAESDMATLLVSHDLTVIAGVCDYVQVMYAGKIVESGPTREVLERPRHPYTRALVRAAPTRDTPAEARLATLPGAPVEPSVDLRGCSLFPRCAYRRERCATDEPALVSFGSGHDAACWVTQAGGELDEC